ncbi:hypothetical protein J4E90_002609 [Alternaria incomplexa]|nr:uncharacterized protein J4E93_007395 [Alternaria ventricosa]XP_049210398.1 uncharacterized protein J4E79_006130 [Alternaria viburni]XP_051293610.1 uncharacterized protein J4E90_002609 [Alternaria incomplexa]XP_051326413.1 uncharacterized protein J4E85_005333 [Alternaria conjuncta]XP_051355842.1 uncharacterized protein J4E92_002761 [Alternaria infectoria]KAI4699607.1 hypothetical protein J4E81_004634 [Alternaria sp. BMP 2799]KAI4708718.1 hypothetical protein J4E89_006777 [Alternaria sp. Ai0
MRFAKAQEKKMGKPESTEPVVKKRAPQKSPISRFWIIVLAFILVGGLLFEVLKLFF